MVKRPLNEIECYRLLENESVGRLATCRNNEPYVIAVNYILFNGKIYIHTGFKGKKLDNLKLNPIVCFEVSRPLKKYAGQRACDFGFEFRSVLVFGEAEIVNDSDQKLEVMNAFMNKYADENNYDPLTLNDMEKLNLIEIKIEKITGRENLRE